MADMNTVISENQDYTGKVKMLDFQGIGYILPDTPNLPELYITPLSLSSTIPIIQEDDCVEFNIKFGGSYSNSQDSIQIINVRSFGVKCNQCKKFGYFSWNCDEKDSILKCSHCRLKGHCSIMCDQQLKGWVFNSDDNNYRSGYDDDDDSKSIVNGVEMFEDWVILEFEPNDGLDKFSNLSICEKSDLVSEDDDDDHDDNDVTIVAESEKVACRDYSHPRHLCDTHSFEKAPKDIHCKMCYCNICDKPAPSKKWNVASLDTCLSHCFSTDKSSIWKACKDLENTQRKVAW